MGIARERSMESRARPNLVTHPKASLPAVDIDDSTIGTDPKGRLSGVDVDHPVTPHTVANLARIAIDDSRIARAVFSFSGVRVDQPRHPLSVSQSPDIGRVTHFLAILTRAWK